MARKIADPRPVSVPEGPGRDLRQTALTYQLTLAALRACVELGIPDHLGSEPRPFGEVAGELPADPDSVYRLLRALTVPGITEESARRAFRLTPKGFALRSDHPDSAAPFIRFILADYRDRVTAALAASVRTGKNAMREVTGASTYEYRARHPEEAALFNAAMTSVTRFGSRAILDAYDFSRFGVVADIGGGQGTLLAAILAEYPKLHGILFDLPDVVTGAPPILSERKVADRCRILGGNFFERVPPAADAYLLRGVLHGLTDEKAIAVLRNIRKVLRPSGAILVMDDQVPETPEPHIVKLLDLGMLLFSGGKERTESEVAHLFEKANLQLTRTVPTREVHSIFEGTPV